MSDLFANRTEFAGPIALSVGVDADDTSWAFTGTIPASLRNGTSRWVLGGWGGEIVIATINAGGTSPMTVVRGAEGSTAAPHSAGAVLKHFLTKAQLPSVESDRALSGKGVVVHAANANAARASNYASVEWIGSVQPVNAVNGDTLILTS